MASFQAKIGWKRQRKRENKNDRFFPFLLDGLEKIPKKQQKNSKNYQIRLWQNFKPKQVRKGLEREKIKIIVPLRFYLTVIENNKKIKTYHYGIISSQNRLEKAEKQTK